MVRATLLGFVRTVLGRFDAASAGLAAALIAGLVVAGSFALAPVLWQATKATIVMRLVETTVMAIIIFVAVAGADEAVDRGAPRFATYAGAIVATALFGACLGHGLTIAGEIRPTFPPQHVNTPYFALADILNMATIGILIGGLATFVHVNRRTALAARRRQHAAELARAQAQRRTLESELRALQARVEPAFLFDTLRRIETLYDLEATRGGAMLEDLIVYLRAALPHLRQSSSTVAQEAQLANSWLAIVGRGNLGWRATFSIADTAGPRPLPALILLPLVQHAASGASSGGADLDMQVSAAATGDRLVMEVRTSTDAFAAAVPRPPLLEAIEQRLLALYGGDARLETIRRDSGSAAVVHLPGESSGDLPAPAHEPRF